jgi:AAA ATPase domain
MLGLPELTQQLRQVIEGLVGILRTRRREGITLAFAALLLWLGYAFSGWLPTELKELLNKRQGVLIIQAVFYLAGILLLLYSAYQIWRLVQVTPLPPPKDRPSAIKGPMAFTEDDGEVFRKLGRESELQELLGYALDNQIPMVTLMGASGAGKTSLLRAGLTHILKTKGVKYHYWEALPTNSAERLLHAIQSNWHEGSSKSTTNIPASLDDLINPTAELCQQNHVIVLDQFEQLREGNTVFRLLRKIAREAKPPHRITWVVTFRREFSANWRDFIIPEQKRGFMPREMSLRLFTAQQAQEIIGQLINEANLSIEQSVVTNLMQAATTDDEVLPVDIGIGLLVLSELHERQSGKTVTIDDYKFAGEAEGLLTQYINRCLERFPQIEQETILKALLELRDPATNQRLAEGLTAEKIAETVSAEPQQLKLQLGYLSQRDVRLLETVTNSTDTTVRYRLPHERLIPALHRLTGKLLAEVDQTKLKFEKAFLAWQSNDKRVHYVLKGKDLKQVEGFASQISWGNSAAEKKTFLQQSRRRRTINRVATVVTIVALFGAGWAASLAYQQYDAKRYLSESGYPSELYEWQHQLKKLTLTEPLDLERFTWLSSNSLEELSLTTASNSNSIAGLTSLSRCRSLKKLSLNLASSEVSNVEVLKELKGLTQLSLSLSSQVSNVEVLKELKGLTHLSLNFEHSDVSNIEVLKELKGLTQLSLSLSSQVSNIEVLKELKDLKELTLNLSGSRVNSVEVLKELKGLTQLELNLGFSSVIDIEVLKELKDLTHLSLYIGDLSSRDSQVGNVEVLKELKDLKEFTLNLSGSQVSNLEVLKELKGLTQLELNLGLSSVKDIEVLKELKDLKELTLGLSGSEVSNVEVLQELKGLKDLTLNLSDSRVSNVEVLKELKGLTHLSLYIGDLLDRVSQVNNLEVLKELKGLTQLELNLSDSSVKDIEVLKQLKDLKELTLNLSGSEVSTVGILKELKGVTHLSLQIGGSRVSNVGVLKELKGLTQLSLQLNGGLVKEVEVLNELLQIEKLSLPSLIRIHRMSIRKIPAKLTDLTF